jgi:pimeloyl-ACP methyl ester carboxylesterase
MANSEFMRTGQPPTLNLPPLPELRTVNVFGCTIRYRELGSGPPLVLIHGIGGDADDWAFCLEPLSAAHRVIAFDLLGFGRSDKPPIDYTIEGFVEVLEQFLGALDIARASIAGNSMGGWIAATFALSHPELVEKLVLVDSAGVWGQMTELPIDLRVSTSAHMREIFQLLFYDKTLAT